MFVYLEKCLSLCVSIFLCVVLSDCLSLCLFACLFVCSCVCLFASLPACLTSDLIGQKLCATLEGGRKHVERRWYKKLKFVSFSVAQNNQKKTSFERNCKLHFLPRVSCQLEFHFSCRLYLLLAPPEAVCHIRRRKEACWETLIQINDESWEDDMLEGTNLSPILWPVSRNLDVDGAVWCGLILLRLSDPKEMDSF